MKPLNYTLIILLVSLTCFSLRAQQVKMGFVDPNYVYSQLPELKAAEATLETLTKQLQKAAQDKKEVLEQKVSEYQKNKEGMSEPLRAATEKELLGLQEQLQLTQQEAQAELKKKQDELLTLIRAKVIKAITEVSTQGNYAYVFDKELLLHTLPGNNISELVLAKLGIKPTATKKNESK